MIVNVTAISKIDWDSEGKRNYHIPMTYDGEWARVRIPLCVICGIKPGKTLTVIGGTHGDEYEGPVAAKKLIENLDFSNMSGRVIIIPVLNVPAFKAGTRVSSLDGMNMNRAFPGDAKGTITSRIARFITDEVLSRSTIVVDIHSAGETMETIRCTSFHEIQDPSMYRQSVETASAFGTPFTMIYTSDMGSGLLTEEAEKMGIVTIGTELGYGASTDLDGVRWAYDGLNNVMKLHKMLPGEVISLLPPTHDRTILVKNTDIDTWMTAPTSGISEPLVPIGAYVRKGDPVTCIHDFEQITKPGYIIKADRDGYVLQRRFRASTRQGDVVMVIAEEVN
ncbi:succinylglutamate desuccinylase [Paenibacillus baekrokdamisoli]|uniref:Succinylglutamate desuccinylase n=1 Tax=Paenibacillus baekrokdamisoli TaxID=1712516 RepID=A0A3G9J2Z8_9BACL|nr:succinylglutamate desuccinylase/aspartoacylase family protein [Paenibacillus baekrokdamisoli]MBB3069484.1 putative deacylase [Paenibacillus baekrokdamisoli]BBH24942.1 succinylglutamate desuccinylase [Paenibacillus baekrokdamisoli]